MKLAGAMFMYNFTAPTCDELVQLREVAAGIRDADLIIRNSQVLCVHSSYENLRQSNNFTIR